MGISSYRIVFLLLGSLLSPFLVECHLKTLKYRSDASQFPPNFLFGTSSSSYQYEGAYTADGKGLSNWDVFTHEPGTIGDGSNGDVAADQYHRYLEDVDLMASMGVNSYRFSISWARILPKGKYGAVNLAGIDYYNKLIDALLLKGIQPFVTLTHYDIPQELEDRYGAWLSPKLQEDFEYFADICFQNFGDRVKYWITFNEPNVFIIQAYRFGRYPPSRCSKGFGSCTTGNSETEPFIAAHNVILAHAAAVNLYRTKYKKQQGGKIGLTVQCLWFEPISNSTADKLAAERGQAFLSNWILDPVILGKYPREMKDILGSALPEFSKNDLSKLQSSLDFIGLNYYAAFYVQDCMFSTCTPIPGTSRTEGFIRQTTKKDGIPLGEPTGMPYFNAYPQGLEKTVTYLKERFNNTPIIITENGYCEASDSNSTIEESVNDNMRVKVQASYLDALSTAMRKGADVRGYFLWSFLDNFEWTFGYTKRFGLYYVDQVTLKRTPKLSTTWYRNFIAEHIRAEPRANS
ncbi:unnamed protein product [Fraxinus pennsylvanica]|uniref:Uncharacterized protein n=1 Tax=Fraxinus pennsylvanica TaxID=56036 RepID=A0AAD1YU25_9LAMI|nr:unnamed protein product [Fraxinus pennsylvanica]